MCPIERLIRPLLISDQISSAEDPGLAVVRRDGDRLIGSNDEDSLEGIGGKCEHNPTTRKMLKPDPAIYYLALDRFGLRPDQALFVDDRQINVEGAEAAGIHAQLFTGVEGLRRRLEREGLQTR